MSLYKCDHSNTCPTLQDGTLYLICIDCGKLLDPIEADSLIGDIRNVRTADEIRMLFGIGRSPITYSLVGRTIIEEVLLSEEQVSNYGWISSPVCLKLDDGTVIIPLGDGEANDPGALDLRLNDGRTLGLD